MRRYDPEYWEAVMPYTVAMIAVHLFCMWLLGRIDAYKKEHPYLSADMRTFYDLVYIGIWLVYVVIEGVIVWQVIRNTWFGGV